MNDMESYVKTLGSFMELYEKLCGNGEITYVGSFMELFEKLCGMNE